MEDYSDYAGDQLVELATEELCEQKGLPMVLRLWIRNCPELIAAQQPVLASFAGQDKYTKRLNFVLGSLYTTKWDGRNLLPKLRLPSYTVTTIAGAGRFLTIQTRTDPGNVE